MTGEGEGEGRMAGWEDAQQGGLECFTLPVIGTALWPMDKGVVFCLGKWLLQDGVAGFVSGLQKASEHKL